MIEAQNDGEIAGLIMEHCNQKEALRFANQYVSNVKTLQKAVLPRDSVNVPAQSNIAEDMKTMKESIK